MTLEEKMAITHMKVFGEMKATDKERLELMEKEMGITKEKAQELLHTFKTLRK